MARRVTGLKQKTKKIPLPRTPKMVDTKYLGLEPVLEDLVDNDCRLTRAYGWYNHFYGPAEAKDWALLRYKEIDPETAKFLARVPEGQFSTTVGWISRMESQGIVLPESSLKWRKNKVLEMVQKVKLNLEIASTPKNKVYKQPSYLSDVANIEDLIDQFVLNDYTNPFSTYEYLQNNNVGKLNAIQIADHFKDLKAELEILIQGKDQDLNEAYRKLKKAQRLAYASLIRSIVEDCNLWSQNKTKARKVTKPKKKSESQILKNFKYLKEHTGLKLVSIDPSKIIGARTLIAFNHKYNKLQVYHAIEGQTLGISTVNITGFDETKSIQKNVRKPEVNLSVLLSGTETAVMKKISEANGAPSVPSKRISQDVVLIKVY